MAALLVSRINNSFKTREAAPTSMNNDQEASSFNLVLQFPLFVCQSSLESS